MREFECTEALAGTYICCSFFLTDRDGADAADGTAALGRAASCERDRAPAKVSAGEQKVSAVLKDGKHPPALGLSELSLSGTRADGEGSGPLRTGFGGGGGRVRGL